MEQNQNQQNRKKQIGGIILYAVALFAILLIINLDAVGGWLGSVLLLLRPILIGLALAYLLNPIFRLFEQRIFFKLRPQGLRRTLSLIMTYLTLLLILALLLLLIVPQLLQSIMVFAQNYEAHLHSAITQLNSIIDRINDIFSNITGYAMLISPIDSNDLSSSLLSWWEENREQITAYLSEINIKPIAEVIGNAVSVLTDTLFGLFISLYLLSTKELRYAQIMKLRRALFSESANQRITQFCRIAHRSFGAFFEGKLLDSLIVGILIYIAISIIGVPYAILIASIIAVMNIIPIIGPIIGAIPASLILLFSAPGKIIPFLIVVIIIQQLDANIICPKILGRNTGISSLCVVIAITTMGALWGLTGMFLSVPLFVAVLDLIERNAESRLQLKGLPSGLENYYAEGDTSAPMSADSTTDKAVQKLERAALHIKKKQSTGEELTRRERMQWFFYSVGHKYHIISEITDDEETRFAAAEAADESRRRAEQLLCEHRAAKADTPD